MATKKRKNKCYRLIYVCGEIDDVQDCANWNEVDDYLTECWGMGDTEEDHAAIPAYATDESGNRALVLKREGDGLYRFVGLKVDKKTTFAEVNKEDDG